MDDQCTGQTVEGYPILGDRSCLAALSPRPWVVCSIGDPRVRTGRGRPLRGGVPVRYSGPPVRLHVAVR